MSSSNRSRVAVLAMALCISAACSQEPKASPAPQGATTQGSEAAPTAEPVASAPTEPAEPEPPPAGPAKITVDAAVHGAAVAATVRMIDEDGNEAASGKTGEALSLQSGDYTLLASIEDAAILADRPTQRIPLTLEPGQDLQQHVDFPWASVQLNVRVNGEPEKKASVRVMRQGAVVATVESGGAHVTLSPGRYQAVVTTRGATIEVKELLFPEGATQSVPVDVRM